MNSRIEQETDILIVDDAPTNLRLLSEILKSQGYRVRPAPNGKLALNAVRKKRPDLILLDILMPDMDGYAVCRALKENETTRDIPVIFVSASEGATDKAKAFALGCVDYIIKPFQPEEVMARVKTHLSLWETKQQLEQGRNALEEKVRERTVDLEKANEKLRKEIAERRNTEEALKTSEKRLKEAQRIAHIGNWDLNQENNELYWSDEIYRIFGMAREEFAATYEGFLSTIHPDDREMVKDAYSTAVKSHTPYEIIHRIIRKNDGEVCYVHEQSEEIMDDTGQVIRSMGTVQDVTERVLAEKELEKHRENLEKIVKERTAELESTNQELKESEEKFRTIAATAHSAIIMFNQDGEIQFWNKAAEIIFGWRSQEVIGKVAHKLLALERCRADYEKGIALFKETGQGPLFGKTQELPALRKDGKEIVIEASITGVHLKGESNSIGIFNDITGRKKAEEEVRRNMEEIERFNRLALGRENRIIALKEEINQLLTQAGEGRRYTSV